MNLFFSPAIWAVTLHEVSTEYPSPLKIVIYLLGIFFFLLLNAFFVASEFAIVKVRPSQLETVEEETPGKARRAISVVAKLDGYLSANQLGITIASLMLGFLGEPFISALVSPTLWNLGVPPEVQIWGFNVELIKWVSLVFAIVTFTFMHVVIGELLPKSIAIRKALATTLLLAKPLHLFYRSFHWAIRILNGTANFLLKKLFRIDPISEGEHIHSAEELALLVTQSGEALEVTETEQEIAIAALELNEIWVRDVMTPRQDVVVLDADEPFEKALEIARRTRHTRFPLVKGGHLDHHIGQIHIKDVLDLVGQSDPDLMRIKRELKMVPDTMPLDTLLKFFLKERQHLALAVDEFGTPVGIVFLDNVIEEIVGDIQDEFDNERPDFVRIGEEEFVVDGTMTLNDLSDLAEELELESGEVTTIGGYITQQLGRFPEVGETMEIEGWEAKVTSTDGRRVGQIHFRKLEPAVTEEIASDEQE
ncbi:CBS domain containing-hemolysin-like protein [Haloferula luteola]|uniref:CBS domain containing-hemolysin-like protein n=1 Tax=Haloferula luteola TaxID=595692 RepID=A0A840V1G4_9BACT|nr:hemolysin family protein [Haloferula luteola]MBB5351233.1 CBS domain containing-hemolysin-like protein [Haloferula luteola]